MNFAFSFYISKYIIFYDNLMIFITHAYALPLWKIDKSYSKKFDIKSCFLTILFEKIIQKDRERSALWIHPFNPIVFWFSNRDLCGRVSKGGYHDPERVARSNHFESMTFRTTTVFTWLTPLCIFLLIIS